jgi:predicted dehydrogenase
MLLSGGEIHDWQSCAPILERCLTHRFDVTHTHDLADLAKLGNGRYEAVVVFYTRGELSSDQLNALRQFVEHGGGLVGVHGAAAAFIDNDGWAKLLGSRFDTHGPILDFTVEASNPSHPVVARTDPFRITDELYLLKTCVPIEPFAVAYWQGRPQPMGYEHQVGKGRVLYLANGHDERAVTNRHFQRMLERAVRVACGERFDGQIKAGILGYGGAFNMGRGHGSAVNDQPGMTTTAVCDLEPKRVEMARQELGSDIAIFTDPQEFIDQGDFDLCIQILPHNIHAKWVIKALKTGRHVVTEKPFCITLDEADAMLAAAESESRMLSCFHNRRWDGDFLKILHLVRHGAIGQIYRIDASTANYDEPRNWWRSQKEIAGGTMYDWGAHYMDWTLNLMNKRIATVTGDFQKRKWFGSTNEDYCFALVRFEDGTTATMEQGNLAAIRRNGWRILGTEGGIANSGPHQDITLVTMTTGEAHTTVIPGGPSTYLPYYQNIGNHLIMGERLVVTPQQARRAIGVIHLAEQSAREGGKPLTLPGEEDYEPDYMLPW